MAGRMSNRDRIQRKAAEADVARREKATKKKKPATKKKSAKKKAVRKKRVRVTKAVPRRKKSAQGRVKIVWVVCDPTGSPIRIYPYREKDEAEAEVKRLGEKSGHTHMLRSDRVPMEEDE